MTKKLLFAAFLAFAGLELAAVPVLTPVVQVTDISQSTLDNLFAQAAVLWETHEDILALEYAADRLTVKHIEEDVYELTWTRSGNNILVALLEDAGG